MRTSLYSALILIEYQRQLTAANDVTAAQADRLTRQHRRAVEEGTVRAVHILQQPALGVVQQPGVLARDPCLATAVRPQVHVGLRGDVGIRPADQHFPLLGKEQRRSGAGDDQASAGCRGEGAEAGGFTGRPGGLGGGLGPGPVPVG